MMLFRIKCDYNSKIKCWKIIDKAGGWQHVRLVDLINGSISSFVE